MATDNEYKAKGEKEKETAQKTTKSKAQKKPNSISILRERFDKKKVKSTIGVTLLLLSVYLFLANFSYLLTWEEDQNRVMSKGLFELLFDDNKEPVANWLGKFGAWSSHLLIYRWFGLASFAIPLIAFVVGFKMLFNIAILPVAKTISASVLTLVWLSLFFGYFSKQVSYAGGAFGYQVNDWLKLSLGRFGALILILAFGYVISMIIFNVNFKKIAAWFNNSKSDDISPAEDVKDPNDMSMSNILDPSQTTDELIARTVHFEEDEEEEEEDDDSEITLINKEPEDDSEIIDEMNKEVIEEEKEDIDVDGLEVEVGGQTVGRPHASD